MALATHLIFSIPSKSLLSDRGLKLISASKPKSDRKGFDAVALSVAVMALMANYNLHSAHPPSCTHIFFFNTPESYPVAHTGIIWYDLGWIKEAESEAKIEAVLLLSFEFLRKLYFIVMKWLFMVVFQPQDSHLRALAGEKPVHI